MYLPNKPKRPKLGYLSVCSPRWPKLSYISSRFKWFRLSYLPCRPM
jgi:hypothetical protein